MPRRVIDLAGRVVGRLTVVRLTQERRQKYACWECLCACGKTTIVTSHNLTNGGTVSCGCYRAGRGRIENVRHGHRRGDFTSPTYITWCAMLARVRRSSGPAVARYRNRGIKVCDRWTDFAAFLADMGPRPDGTTIDRINNDGDYEPGNCRWATPKEQQANRSCSKTRNTAAESAA